MKIAGTRIILRDEGKEGDDEDIFRWLNMDDWVYYAMPHIPFRGITWEEFIRREERRKSDPSRHDWQLDTVEGRHIGWVDYHGLDEQAGHIRMGIALPEETTWNQGYGTEAVRLLIDYLFREMGLKEVRTSTWSGNKRMMRCAEKCGFNERSRGQHGGGEYSVRGEPLERIEYFISREEWLDQTSANRKKRQE